jgi:predicted site-specific integrase-resolvase
MPIKRKVLATYGGFMNKQQAAEFLGVSVRALERYVQQGRISVRDFQKIK